MHKKYYTDSKTNTLDSIFNETNPSCLVLTLVVPLHHILATVPLSITEFPRIVFALD